MTLRMFAAIVLFTMSAVAGGCSGQKATESSAEVTLLRNDAKKVENSGQGQLQYRYGPASIVYNFENKKSVLILKFDNSDAAFPMEASLHRFASQASADSIRIWIGSRNDEEGGYDIRGIALPFFEKTLPSDCCAILSRRKVESQIGRDILYDKFEVEFGMKSQQVVGQFTLEPFTDKTHVYVRTESSQ